MIALQSSQIRSDHFNRLTYSYVVKLDRLSGLKPEKNCTYQVMKLKRLHSSKKIAKKSNNEEFGSFINPRYLTPDSRHQLIVQRQNGSPYEHIYIQNLFQKDKLRLAQDEAKNCLSAEFKESDLFKVYQTIDLGNMDQLEKKKLSKLRNLYGLKEYLYGKEFRDFISDITGERELTNRVDCSINIYTNGCHLLCHDDVIGTRRVSYIIYLTDPDELWLPEDGGALELFPLEPSSVVESLQNGRQGIPTANPTTNLLPLFNSMAIFAVQPGRSYHSVQEVYSDKPRMSISGWFHGHSPAPGADLASLKLIMTRGDDETSFAQLNFQDFISAELTEADFSLLREFVNPLYLESGTMEEVSQRFIEESSLQLKDFLRTDLAVRIGNLIASRDIADKLSQRAPYAYDVGAREPWHIEGPAHKCRYLQLRPRKLDCHPIILTEHLEVGDILSKIQIDLFQSASFSRYLHKITTLQTVAFKGEIRRFRPGLDYTVAHYGGMTREPRLDATLCFVTDNPVKTENCRADVDDREDDDNDEIDDDNDIWASGDVGGFECYIEAEDDAENVEAAEVFKSSSLTDFQESKQSVSNGKKRRREMDLDSNEAENNVDDVDFSKENSLLSIAPGMNVLNLVMRDDKVMRFIKYLSANAPSSRYDVSMEYEYAVRDD